MMLSGLLYLLLLMITVQAQSNSLTSIDAGQALDGFCPKGLRYDELLGCTDINECTEQAPCKDGQRCRNLYGDYLCICPAGFTFNKQTGHCDDKDECAMGFCGSGQRCINTIGLYTCYCMPGTKQIGRFCRDINECIRRPCASNQHCINTRGSYMCRCRSGYQDRGDGRCMDRDECALGMCRGTGEECRNTVGGYQCACKNGFVKDELTQGRYCIDVNECDLDQCPRHSECINSQGSYYCRCHRGFTKLNGICVDNQECILGEGSKCQWRCQNIPGSFTCECPLGYNRVDFACTDINECDSNGKRLCQGHRTCVNTHGSYKCVDALKCPEGGFYRKLMTTDEFGYRQVTTNTCRRRKCSKFAKSRADNVQCRRQPLSVSYHYVDITSNLPASTKLVHVRFPARRRRQRYHFNISHGDTSLFSLRQPSPYRPLAYLMINRPIPGPAEVKVEVDMRTYNRRNQMRDNRMMTILVLVSRYTF